MPCPYFTALMNCQACQAALIPAVTFAKFVGIESPATRACTCAYKRTFLATCQAADSRAAQRGSGHCQFIAMLLPKRPMTMPVTSRVRRRNRAYRPDCEDEC